MRPLTVSDHVPEFGQGRPIFTKGVFSQHRPGAKRPKNSLENSLNYSGKTVLGAIYFLCQFQIQRELGREGPPVITSTCRIFSMYHTNDFFTIAILVFRTPAGRSLSRVRPRSNETRWTRGGILCMLPTPIGNSLDRHSVGKDARR
jgi:hypothetical protein